MIFLDSTILAGELVIEKCDMIENSAVYGGVIYLQEILK